LDLTGWLLGGGSLFQEHIIVVADGLLGAVAAGENAVVKDLESRVSCEFGEALLNAAHVASGLSGLRARFGA